MDQHFSDRTKKIIRKKCAKGGESREHSNSSPFLTNYLLTLSYDGSGFCGWQSQQNAERTVQDVLTRVATAVFKQPIKMEASGRTDAGVHAIGQSVSFLLEGRIKPEKMKKILNHSLPADLRVIEVQEVPTDFHARYHATAKTYVYKIKNTDVVNVFDSRYYHYVSHPLDVEMMKRAARFFCGTHDFANFSASNHGKKSTVRTIRSITVDISNFGGGAVNPDEKRERNVAASAAAQDASGNADRAVSACSVIEITVEGEGFLWKMVRMIAQTLIDVGLGAVQPGEIRGLFKKKNRRKEAAPACGLYLKEVQYQD